jgi:flavin-dependent dehydrogenase
VPRLNQLRLAERFEATQPVAVYGVESAWGSVDLASNSFVSSPYNHGWHVERGSFDRMMSKAAEDAGVSVFRHTRARTIEAGRTPRWVLNARTRRGEQRFSASFLVDGTGRSARLAAKLGVRRRRIDTLIAVCVVYSTRAAQDTSTPPAKWHDVRGQRHTRAAVSAVSGLHGPTASEGAMPSLVESHPLGWWYSAGLPSGQVVAMFFTDSDICAQHKLAHPVIWDRFLSESLHTRERMVNLVRVSNVARVFPVSSHFLDPAAGPGWIAVGDAAIGRDPLASSGVDFALASAARAFSALQGLATGDQESLASYRCAIAEDFSTYTAQRRAFYEIERRWSEAPFWQRRRGATQKNNIGNDRQ